ncbi:MAG: hypothetical protein QOD51_1443, partial [Candidatus Eremiobacteraeota bacterium]|nr:hypothetical protein [Candidatus Eremiobacteraeota bacterium]
MMRWRNPSLLDEVCDEMDVRFVLVHPEVMIAACGFVESDSVRVPVSRDGDPRNGGKYTFWLTAVDAYAVEDYFDELERINAAIRERVSRDADGQYAARNELFEAFYALRRTRIDVAPFDLDAFAAEHGITLGPTDPFDMLADVETRREARRRQRRVHVHGLLDDEFLLEAARDRAQALAAAGGGIAAERYADVAKDLDARLCE